MSVVGLINNLMFQYIKNIKNLDLFFIFYFLFHLFFINLDPINDEYIFYSGSDFINTKSKEIIGSFFDYNANTLGFSYLIFFISKILQTDNFFIIGKIISLSGYIFLYFGLKNFCSYIKLKETFFVYLALFMCPLIWTYGFRATPDFFSFSLAFYAASKLISKTDLTYTVILYLCVSLSVIIKPFNGIVLLIIFLCNHQNIFNKLNYRNTLVGFVLFGVISCSYYIFNYDQFGFIFNPPQWRSTDFYIENYFENIVYYLGFINLYIIPFTFKFLLKFKYDRKDFLFLLSIIIIISIILFLNWNDKFFGELNFGSLSKFINIELYKLFLGLNAIYFIFYFYAKFKSTKNLIYLNLFMFTFIYIIIMSIFMPAQRYTLILIPFLYLIALKENNYKFLNYLIILLYIFFNFTILNNHLIISDLSKKTSSYIQSKDIFNQTYPGYFGQHSLSKFTKFYDQNLNIIKKEKIFEKKKKYTIKTFFNENDEVIFSYKSEILFMKKEIFIIKNF